MDKVIIGDATLYHGDCMDILPTLGKVDAVVTDPPYGIGDMWQGGKKEWPLHHQDGMEWDGQIVKELPNIINMADAAIVWGGHLYDLPPNRGWLIWDKLIRKFTSGHCEMAWTTLDQPIKAFNFSHGALATEGKLHPTQKPLPLMEWCISFLADCIVCDPFMGSGTTGVACVNLGRKFVGIEIERKYFDIACERIEAAYAQGRLAL